LIVIGTLAGAVGFWVFWLSVIGIFCVLAGTTFGFWGTHISDKGYLETIRLLKTHVETARKRQEPVWTPFKRIEAIEGISPMAIYAIIQFRLWSDDNTIPLMIRIASVQNGKLMSEVAGPSGIVNQMLTEPCTFYISLSHPTIKYQISISGYKYSNL
jgi:hypothetical protein